MTKGICTQSNTLNKILHPFIFIIFLCLQDRYIHGPSSTGSSNPRFSLGESCQNPWWTRRWSFLQRACKTQGSPLVSPTGSRHHVFSTCYSTSDTYARARHHTSCTCHSMSDTYARARHHVSSTWHFSSDTYARAQHHISRTYRSMSDMYAWAWHIHYTHQAHQIQGLPLVSLAKIQDGHVLGEFHRFIKPKVRSW